MPQHIIDDKYKGPDPVIPACSLTEPQADIPVSRHRSNLRLHWIFQTADTSNFHHHLVAGI